MDIAISVKNLSKKYRLYDSPQHRLKEALHPFRKKFHRDFWALRDVSFEVKKGESMGIIGKNGSGKSTLLQMLSGVLQQTEGEINVTGKVSALLELGAGFNPEFTGRQNVYMNGALLGFSRDEMEERFPAIADFADIGDFIDQPVKTYSSGMYVRLAFAVAINVEPDILVVDEALSVGDIFFQQKCFSTVRAIIDRGTTCLFVSHDTAAIMNICSKVVLLDSGRIDFQGPPEEAISRYYSKLALRPKRTANVDSQIKKSSGHTLSEGDILAQNILTSETPVRHGKRGMEILAACVVDGKGKPSFQVNIMDSLSFYLLLQANEDIAEPGAGIHLYDRLGNLVFAAGNFQLKSMLPPLSKGEKMIVGFDLYFNVQPGEYTFELALGEPSDEGPNVGFFHDKLSMLGPIKVISDATQVLPFYGIAQLPMSIRWEKTIV